MMPPVRRKSAVLPLVVAAAVLVGLVGALGIGLFVGYQIGVAKAETRIAGDNPITRKQIEPAFVSSPGAEPGWFFCQFEDMGISLILPGEPIPGYLRPDELDYFRYSNVKNFSLYEAHREPTAVYLARYHYFTSNIRETKSMIEEHFLAYRNSPEYSAFKPAAIREMSYGGVKGYEGSATFNWEGKRFKLRMFMTLEDYQDFQVNVVGPQIEIDKVYSKVLASLKFSPSSKTPP